jgi:CRP-like cAMP-binding protein
MNINERERQLIEKFLKRVPIFRSFSEEHLKNIVNDFSTLTVAKGKDIVFQSDEGTDLFIVLKGLVKVSLLSTDGQELVLTNFRAGDFFGEMSLIDGRSRSANVVAEEETSLGVLHREKLLISMKNDPVIAFDFLTAIVERLRKSDEMIETLAFLDVNERLIKFLVRSAKDEGGQDEDGWYRTKKRTHLDLAANIGSSREAVSKALKVLAFKEAIIEKDGSFLISSDAYKALE